MSGFVVEIFSSASKPGDPRVWFAELDGQPCVVSAFGLARIFATRDEARAAAGRVPPEVPRTVQHRSDNERMRNDLQAIMCRRWLFRGGCKRDA